MGSKKALSAVLWPSKRGFACSDDVKIDGMSSSPCTHMPGPVTNIGKQKCTVIQTSTLMGCIHSVSLSPTSSRIAIAYGNEIALTDVIPNPYRLKDNREYLPKPPASPHGSSKSGGPIAKSLQFMRKKNRLVATYTAHGIVYVPGASLWTELNGDFSIWDPHTLTITGEIIPRTFPM